MSAVALPVTAGTVRAAALHPDNRPNEHGETPFASLLDTGTGPRIQEKPAPRSERSRQSDKSAHSNTAEHKPAPEAAKSEASSDAPVPADSKDDPEPDAKEHETKLADAVVELVPDVDAATVAETDTDAQDAATIVDALATPSTEAIVTAATTPIVAAPVTPVQPSAESAATSGVTTDSEAVTEVAGVTDAPGVAASAKASDTTVEAQAPTPAGKIVPKPEKPVDAIKPDPKAEKQEAKAVKGDAIEEAKPEAHKPHQAHVQPSNEAPAEHKPAAKPAIESLAEAKVSAADMARTGTASNVNANADIALQASAPVQTAPVVTPAAATQPQALAAAPVPISGLAVEIVSQAREGKNRFEIRLDPPDLGRVDVRLDIDGQGNVTSRLVVERQDTLDLLRREPSALERALHDAGLKTSNDGLQFSLRDQGFNNARREDAGGRFARVVVPNDATAGSEISSYRLPRLGGLDIRV